MIKIKRALISVSDKTGIVDFARQLSSFGVEILSTGGTARLLKENAIKVVEVSDYTGFPEMLSGRVKTLHPKIHAGLLALREKAEHMQALEKHSIGLIDMVVVNLYPFQQTITKKGVSRDEAIENIDKSQVSFSISPEFLYQVYMKAEKENKVITGIFHSHPTISAPSSVDLKFMEYNPVAWIILGITDFSNVNKEDMKAFQYFKESIRRVKIKILDD